MPDLVCSPNAVFAFDYLVGKGLKDFQAAAVIGNLQQESGLNPRAFFQKEASYGIAQWRFERFQNLLAYAAGGGRDPWSFDVQLEFLWHELETKPEFGLAPLVASTSLEAATVIFQDRFERCGDCRTASRIALAQSALYSCPNVTGSPWKSSGWVLLAGAAVAAVGFGAYKLLSERSAPEPEPEPENAFYPRPAFRRFP
jgi:Phage tail lysozyme